MTNFILGVFTGMFLAVGGIVMIALSYEPKKTKKTGKPRKGK